MFFAVRNRTVSLFFVNLTMRAIYFSIELSVPGKCYLDIFFCARKQVQILIQLEIGILLSKTRVK